MSDKHCQIELKKQAHPEMSILPTPSTAVGTRRTLSLHLKGKLADCCHRCRNYGGLPAAKAAARFCVE